MLYYKHMSCIVLNSAVRPFITLINGSMMPTSSFECPPNLPSGRPIGWAIGWRASFGVAMRHCSQTMHTVNRSLLSDGVRHFKPPSPSRSNNMSTINLILPCPPSIWICKPRPSTISTHSVLRPRSSPIRRLSFIWAHVTIFLPFFPIKGYSSTPFLIIFFLFTFFSLVLRSGS